VRRKVFIVATREFLSTVKRRSYLIVTFGMPFFLSLYVGLVALLPTIFMAQSGASKKDVGLVDEAHLVRSEELERAASGEGDELSQAAERLKTVTAGRTSGMAASILKDVTAPIHFRLFPDRAQGIEAVRSGTIEKLYVVPADYLERGGVDSYQKETASMSLGRARARESLEVVLSRSLLADRVPETLRPRIEHPVLSSTSQSFTVGGDGRVKPFDLTSRIARLAIPGVFAILFLMSVMISSGYLLQGVAEEKENRVIEIILSSVRPHELLFGKLLGLGAAGLVQLVIWIAVGTFAVSLMAAAALAVLDFKLFVSCLVFFVLGFLMLGSLMTGTGALGSNARESQQLSAVWTLTTVMPPALTWMGIMEEPNGTLARILGWFPLTAPITMMLRLGTGQVPWWDVAVAVLILMAGVFLAIRLAGGLLRLGLLMYGKRPSLPEIIRLLRHS
jgi:ABC-2 type transport system permease protein